MSKPLTAKIEAAKQFDRATLLVALCALVLLFLMWFV